MKFLTPILLLLMALSLVSCDKESEEIQTQELDLEIDPSITDSIYFTLDNKTYSSNIMDGFGFANKQTNIKPYTNVINSREAAYITGGYWWYGEKDSLLFEQTFSFKSPEFSNISLGVSQKYATKELLQKSNLLIPDTNDTAFKVGPQAFAIDNNLENSTYGISLTLSHLQQGKSLTTSIPAFSILLRSDLDKNLQDDAYFEIISIDSLQNNILQVEARFEANMYTEEGKSHRLTDGYVRFKTKLNYLK